MRTNKVSLVLFLLFSGFASAFSPFFLKAANSDVIDPTGGATLTASFTDRLGGFDITPNGDVAATNLLVRECNSTSDDYETGFVAASSALSNPTNLNLGERCRSSARALRDVSLAGGGLLEDDWHPNGTNALARLWSESGSSQSVLHARAGSIWSGLPMDGLFSIVNKVSSDNIVVGSIIDAGLSVSVGFAGTDAGGISEIPSYPDAVGGPTMTYVMGVNKDLTGGQPFLVGSSGQTNLEIGGTTQQIRFALSCKYNSSGPDAAGRCRIGTPWLNVSAPWMSGGPVAYQSTYFNGVSNRYSCKAPLAVGGADYYDNVCVTPGGVSYGCRAGRVAVACSLVTGADGRVTCPTAPTVLVRPSFDVNPQTSPSAEFYIARGVSPDGRFVVGYACQAGTNRIVAASGDCANLSMTQGVLWDLSTSTSSSSPVILAGITDTENTSLTWRIITVNAVNDRKQMVGFGKRSDGLYFAVRLTPSATISAFQCPRPSATFAALDNEYGPECVVGFVNRARDLIGQAQFSTTPSRDVPDDLRAGFVAYEAVVAAATPVFGKTNLVTNSMNLKDFPTGNANSREARKKILYGAIQALGLAARTNEIFARWETMESAVPSPVSAWALAYVLNPDAFKKTCG